MQWIGSTAKMKSLNPLKGFRLRFKIIIYQRKRGAGYYLNNFLHTQTPAVSVSSFYKLVGFIKIGNLHICTIPK